MNFKDWIINEASVSDLYHSTVAAFPRTTKRQHSTDSVKIIELKWTPFLGINTLLVRSVAQNEGREYNPLILFKNIQYKEGGELELVIENRTYLFDRISKTDDDILVRCNCKDFKFRFAYYDKLWDNCLYGSVPPRYISQGLRPPANPQEMPGMCKHLIVLSNVLSHAGIFK